MAVRRISPERPVVRLSSSDLRAALDLVARVSAAAAPDAFALEATRGLREVVRCDFATYNEISVAAGRTVVLTDPPEVQRPDAQDAFDRNLHEHPIAVHYSVNRGAPALTMSDFVGLRAFRETSLYDELYRPVDGNYVLAVHLPVPRGLVVGFALVRSARDFGQRDRALLDLLKPHLARAYRESLRRSALGIALEDGDAPLVILALDGRPLYATDPALAAFERVLGWAPRPGEFLPRGMKEWLEGGCPGALVITGSKARLRVEAMGERPSVLLVSERPVLPPAESFRSLGLTRRESEVLAHLAAGRTNADIAARLTISPRTVKKHVEGVYEKLGVGTRTAAVAIALAAV